MRDGSFTQVEDFQLVVRRILSEAWHVEEAFAAGHLLGRRQGEGHLIIPLYLPTSFEKQPEL